MSPWAEIVGALVGAAAGAARSGHESHRWLWQSMRDLAARIDAVDRALAQHASAPADQAHGEGSQ